MRPGSGLPTWLVISQNDVATSVRTAVLTRFASSTACLLPWQMPWHSVSAADEATCCRATSGRALARVPPSGPARQPARPGDDERLASRDDQPESADRYEQAEPQE